jgi:hypothetical protein
MSLQEIYYDKVKTALLKDGWTLTHDPLRLLWDDTELEPVLGAEKEDQRIAVTISSFAGPSDVSDLERALGQYLIYQLTLKHQYPGYLLYLAVSEETWYSVFDGPIGELVLPQMRLLVFSSRAAVIRRWLSAAEGIAA